MTITAEIIAHSRSCYHDMGVPDIATFFLRYPRFIHAEVMTHRVFSRNASSSRAIPVERLIDDVLTDPAIPSYWGKNKPGMQADEELDVMLQATPMAPQRTPSEAWLIARDKAVDSARLFADAGYHKQVVNRILEPYSHINVVVTSTNYDNFFWLRRHADAQPEIRLLADAMYDALQASDPTTLEDDEWHMPFVKAEDRAHEFPYMLQDHDVAYDPITDTDLLKISAARCARTSYLTFAGKPSTPEQDINLYHKLVGSEPLHASPTEHQAKPSEPVFKDGGLPHFDPRLSGNLAPGWIQFRKTLRREYCNDYQTFTNQKGLP